MYAQLFAAVGAVPCLAYLVTTLGNTRAEDAAGMVLLAVTSATLLIGVFVDVLVWRRGNSEVVL